MLVSYKSLYSFLESKIKDVARIGLIKSYLK